MAVITKEDELKKILTHKNNYSFDKLRKYFCFDNDFLLMEFLIKYLEENINDFNFETDYSKNKYLFKLVKYFNYNLSRIDLDSEYDDGSLEIINGMKGVCETIILKKKEFDDTSMSDNCYDNMDLLDKILDGTLIAIKNIKTKLMCEDSSIFDLESDLCEITKKIIRKFKNNEYLRIMMNSYPELIYLKDKNNYLFSDLVDNYLDLLLTKNCYTEKIYYDKVLDLYMRPDNIDDKEIIRDIFFSKIYKFINKLEFMDIDKDKRAYIMSAIKERIHQTKVDEIDFLSDKSNQEYYKEINFDILGPLIGTKTYVDRSDFTYRYVITIDSDEANILENAISVHKKGDKYLLSIYTPDIVEAISENRDFEKNQYNNALNNPPKRRIFNSSISKEKFSLDEGKISKVFAYQFLIDKDFNCYNFDFRRANIIVKKNLKVSDFNTLNQSSDIELKDNIQKLLELTYPDLSVDDNLDVGVANMINMVINGFAVSHITRYCRENNLPLIYFRTDFKSNNSKIYRDSQFNMFVDQLYEIDKNEVISTIGNDGIYGEDNFSISLFSPLRKISALINQMLVCIYCVNHNHELDFSTRNYLETRLDKICNNINDINRCSINNKKEYIMVKKRENNNEQ